MNLKENVMSRPLVETRNENPVTLAEETLVTRAAEAGREVVAGVMTEGAGVVPGITVEKTGKGGVKRMINRDTAVTVMIGAREIVKEMKTEKRESVKGKKGHEKGRRSVREKEKGRRWKDSESWREDRELVKRDTGTKKIVETAVLIEASVRSETVLTKAEVVVQIEVGNGAQMAEELGVLMGVEIRVWIRAEIETEPQLGVGITARTEVEIIVQTRQETAVH